MTSSDGRAGMGNLEFSVLGPVEVRRDGEPIELARGKAVSLLATLLASANRVVLLDRLMDVVWGEKLPEHPHAAVYSIVARLRRMLGDAVIDNTGAGYRLRVDPERLDLLRFQRLMASVPAMEDAAAVVALEEAIGLWREPLLGNVTASVLREELVPLWTERYLDACEEWAERCLRLARHQVVAARLSGLVAAHPLRERMVGQLMLALWRGGRTAEALRTYEALRRRVGEELGVDPSGELRDLHVQILRGGANEGRPDMSAGPRWLDRRVAAAGLIGRDEDLRVVRGALHDHRVTTVLPHADPDGTVAGPSAAGLSEPSPSTPEYPPPGEPVAALRPGHMQWVPSAPRQLPAGVAGFAGRAEALTLLSELAKEAVGGPGGVVIAAISGMAGVGKTSLALHWAHYEVERFTGDQLSGDLRAGDPASPAEVTRGFPDGQLYANLRGFDPSGAPASPTEVICGFLDALGVPPARIPVGLEAQAGLYRTMLAERHVLIVLDNARDATQVFPLLPGSAGCMVLVTSRNPLTPLAAGYGAHLISLDVLTDDEAAELLSRRLGAGRMAADPETATVLAALCGRLPLALAITAARAAARPGLPLAIFFAELRDARKVLDALDAGDPASNLRAVLSWSCQELSGQATDLLPLLSIHPGPDISLPAAASLAGSSTDQIGAAMRELAGLHLVTEHRSGRYILHGLVRAYAAEQADATISANQRRAAVSRMLDHYLHTALIGDATLSPAYYPLPTPISPAHDGTTPEDLGGREQAMDWFQAEHRVLIAITTMAASSRLDSHAWQLPMTFFRYLDWHGLWDDWDGVLRIAHAAAQRLADQAAQACILRSGGMLSMRHGSYQEAHRQFEKSLHFFAALDDPIGQARAHGDLSMLFSIQDRYREALAHSERALELSAVAGHPHLHAASLNKVGWHAAHLGDYERGLAACEQALALQQSLGNRHSEAFVWDSLGYIHQHLQHHAQSVKCFQRSVSLFAEIGNRFELAATLSNLGDARNAASQPAAARDVWLEALAILTELHHHDATQLEAKIAAL